MTDGTKPVRVVAVTQSDPFFTARFFEAFLEERSSDRLELVEIVLLRNFNESKPALVRRLFRLYGPVDFMRLLGRYVTAAVSDRVGRPRSVEAIAARYGVPVVRLPTINDASYLRTLTARGVDVLLSVAAPEIFRRPALTAVPHVLNVHSGKLPLYRGMMPTFWLSRTATRVSWSPCTKWSSASMPAASSPSSPWMSGWRIPRSLWRREPRPWPDGSSRAFWPRSERRAGRSRARFPRRVSSTTGFPRGMTRGGCGRGEGGYCDRAGIPGLVRRGRLVPRREFARHPRRRRVVIARGAGRTQHARSAGHPGRDRGQGHVFRAGMDRPAAPAAGAPDRGRGARGRESLRRSRAARRPVAERAGSGSCRGTRLLGADHQPARLGTAGSELLDRRRCPRLPGGGGLLVRLELLPVQGARPLRPAGHPDRPGCPGGVGPSRPPGVADVARRDRAVRGPVVRRWLFPRHPLPRVSLGRGEAATRPIVVYVLLSPVGAGQRGSAAARHAAAAQAPSVWGTGPNATGSATPADGIRVGADRSDAQVEGFRPAASGGWS